MRALVVAFLLVVAGPVWPQQSSFPSCPDIGLKHNCFGVVTDSEGAKYVGEFQGGKRSGQGTQTFTNQEKYVGGWSDDKPKGMGTLSWPNGKPKYVGGWFAGQPHGPGIEYSATGTVRRSGIWAQGDFQYAMPLSYSPASNVAVMRQDEGGEKGLTGSPTQTSELKKPSDTATQTQDQRRNEEVQRNAEERRQQEDVERQRLVAEVDAERKRRQELEERLAAESKERERLATEARERERLLAEARERERSAPPQSVAPTIRSAHALVIGNAAYPGSARLDNPINDANAIGQKLRSMGFNVTTVTDANRQRLVQAMSQFRRTAAAADVSLLFYSGHGVQILGKNYMLPTDVDQTDIAQATIQGVSLNEVVENFLPGKTKLVFLDACRDNPLQRTGDRSVSRGLAPIAVAEGTLIAYATKDGQVASDGPGQRNSPFTQALLDHIADPNDIAVVLRKVREKVMRSTGGKQQPWEYGSLTGGELVLSAIRPAK